MSAILDFYRGAGTGGGRTFDQILALDDFLMERVHDWLQWGFPLPEASKAQPKSPVLTPEDIEAFKVDPELQAQVRLMQARYTLFLHNTTDWKDRYDHNHLRITRVLRFLTLIGMQSEAQTLYQMLTAEHPGLPAKTEWFWQEAMTLEPAWLTEP